MVMIVFVGVATFDKSGTGATSILQSVIQVSPKRQLKNVTLASSCSYYASCTAARSAAVEALGSQPVMMTYRIPRHTGCSPYRCKYLGEEPSDVRLSGAEEGSVLLLLLCRWFSLACSGHPPRSNNLQVRMRKKRKKRRKCSLGDCMSLIGRPD